jgi:hypothetical protein
MSEFKRKRLEHLAYVLADHCHRKNMPCMYNENEFDSCCPFEFDGTYCKDITPTDWLKYMQGIEVSEL